MYLYIYLSAVLILRLSSSPLVYLYFVIPLLHVVHEHGIATPPVEKS